MRVVICSENAAVLNDVLKLLNSLKIEQNSDFSIEEYEDNGVYCFKKDRKVMALGLSQIISFESLGRQVVIKSLAGNFTHYSNMSDIVEKVGNRGFIQINRGCIVNMKHIVFTDYNVVKMPDSCNYYLTQKYREKFKSAYNFDF